MIWYLLFYCYKSAIIELHLASVINYSIVIFLRTAPKIMWLDLHFLSSILFDCFNHLEKSYCCLNKLSFMIECITILDFNKNLIFLRMFFWGACFSWNWIFYRHLRIFCWYSIISRSKNFNLLPATHFYFISSWLMRLSFCLYWGQPGSFVLQNSKIGFYRTQFVAFFYH